MRVHLPLILLILAAPVTALGDQPRIRWAEALKQRAEWYASEEAVRVADNLLLYQRETGGWPKNIDMAAPLTEEERAALLKQKSRRDDSTIDNGATYTQLEFLARVYAARRLERHRAAFMRGLEYLLAAQYANGGWPQYYPDPKGYHAHVTFNDGAMIGVMRLLRDVARRHAPYLFVDETTRRRAEEAVRKGIELILRTQIVVRGERTAWCAQYDERTLAPAWARRFEPPALASRESVGVVRFLMSLESPNARVRGAIESAIKWFERSKIYGIRWVERQDGRGHIERVVIKDPQAGPIWARFYEIETNRPIFAGRDAVVRYDVMQIEEERRNGYAWYVTDPAELIGVDYPRWQRKFSSDRESNAGKTIGN
jgi:PelA/Pel-15E family pectate lyase